MTLATISVGHFSPSLFYSESFPLPVKNTEEREGTNAVGSSHLNLELAVSHINRSLKTMNKNQDQNKRRSLLPVSNPVGHVIHPSTSGKTQPHRLLEYVTAKSPFIERTHGIPLVVPLEVHLRSLPVFACGADKMLRTQKTKETENHDVHEA